MSVWKLELMDALNSISSEEHAEAWDNGGIQVDAGTLEIHRILVALEVTTEVIKEARELEADYIVVHHPVLFEPLKSVDIHEITGSHIVQLIKSDISVYAAHTSFDLVKGGTNDYLAELLELTMVRKMQHLEPSDEFGVVGELKAPSLLLDVIEKVSEALELDRKALKIVGDLTGDVRTVGIVTGAGGRYVEDAILNGCDVFITGDLKYHDARLAKEAGLAVIDAGHYGTEKSFVPNMAAKLKKALGPEVEIIESTVDIDPFTTI